MVNLLRWFRALAFWVFDGWRVWAPVLLVAILLGLMSFAPGAPEDHARYVGLVLQLLGIATVVRGVRDRRLLFQRPSLIGHLKTWLARRPRLNPTPTIINASAACAIAAGGTAKVSVWRSIPPDASLEDRVEALRINLESLRNEQSETYRELCDEVRNRNQVVESERQARESAVSDVRSRLDMLGTGGLHIESAGLFWLITGVVFGTIPAEVASLLRLP